MPYWIEQLNLPNKKIKLLTLSFFLHKNGPTFQPLLLKIQLMDQVFRSLRMYKKVEEEALFSFQIQKVIHKSVHNLKAFLTKKKPILLGFNKYAVISFRPDSLLFKRGKVLLYEALFRLQCLHDMTIPLRESL